MCSLADCSYIHITHRPGGGEQKKKKTRLVSTWANLRALRRPSTLFGGWSLRTLMQPFICGPETERHLEKKALGGTVTGMSLYLHQFWMTWQMLLQDGRSRIRWLRQPSPWGRKTPSPRWRNGFDTPWQDEDGWDKCKVESNAWSGCREATYGVSNMTLHTLAIVLRQSVVFSIGRFLFWNKIKRVEGFIYRGRENEYSRQKTVFKLTKREREMCLK